MPTERQSEPSAAQSHVETIRDYIRNSVPQWETPIPFPAAEAWDAVTALASELERLRAEVEQLDEIVEYERG